MNRLPKFLEVNANWYSFLSASELAISINLFTGATGGDTLPVRYEPILWSTALAMVAAIFWGLIAWKLDFIQRSVIARRPDFVDEERAWRAVLTDKMILGFRSLLWCALITSIVSFCVLPLRIELPEKKPASRAPVASDSVTAGEGRDSSSSKKSTVEPKKEATNSEVHVSPVIVFSLPSPNGDAHHNTIGTRVNGETPPPMKTGSDQTKKN